MPKLKQGEPTEAGVRALAARLARAYEDDELGHMEPHELTEAVRELLILSRRVGIELDDQYHPVDQVVNAVAQYDYDYAAEILSEMQAQEIRDRRMLAEAEASAARERVVNAAGEIMERSGSNRDELRSGIVSHLMRNTPAPDTEYEAVETAREIERAARATAKTVEHADIRASILGALPASQSPFGRVHSARRQGAIQDHVVSTANWEEDLETASPTLTHEETRSAQEVAKGEILAAARGPAELRSYREEHNINLDEYA